LRYSGRQSQKTIRTRLTSVLGVGSKVKESIKDPFK